MSQGKKLRTYDDLLRVVRALAYEFKTDTVFIVGSQAILASMPDAPEAARESPEIDAFPQNAKIWEVEEAQRTRDGVRPIASNTSTDCSDPRANSTARTVSTSMVSMRRRPSFRRGGKAARSRCGRRSKVGP